MFKKINQVLELKGEHGVIAFENNLSGGVSVMFSHHPELAGSDIEPGDSFFANSKDSEVDLIITTKNVESLDVVIRALLNAKDILVNRD